jgi:hypothetical protein
LAVAFGKNAEHAEANANLIAAAPEMLNALLGIKENVELYLTGKISAPEVAMWADEHIENKFRDILSAIAKATGGTL